jgi:DNA ligase-1
MRRFARLFSELDESNKTLDKVQALVDYFSEAPPEDAVWVLWFLHGNRLQLGIPSKRLRHWAADLSGHPDWLVDACYERVGDLAETAALLLPLKKSDTVSPPLNQVIQEQLLPLRNWDDRFQFQLLRDFWLSLSRDEVLVLNKMLTGGFRVGVSKALLIRSLGEALQIDRATLTHRLMGEWEPTGEFFRSLADPEANVAAQVAQPYPFYLASALTKPIQELGPPQEWIAEWKWDGIRAQLIRRNGETHLWSRGDERLNDAFPELIEAGTAIPDGTVLDGEILCWKEGLPMGFHVLQTRINRKSVDRETLETAPVRFLAYDCMEWKSADMRSQMLETRRAAAQAAIVDQQGPFALSPHIDFKEWTDLSSVWEESRSRKVEGMMLKRLSSDYKIGRVKGDWWKWKVDPHTADLVLIYAQAGHGRRATLYTDYTLAARDGDSLVPVAKAYSGLTDIEMRQVDRWIKQNTVAKRGPVRTVPPQLVFEIGFEGLRPSTRHRSGIAMRFPRILRWRHDKSPDEADSLESLKALIE